MRCVTFNIQHGTQGLQKVIGVLQELAPDLVFLQEVDRGCVRSGGADQAEEVAHALGMNSHFAEAFPFDGGSYGIALLARQALRSVETIRLPHPSPRQSDGNGEPRLLLVALVGKLTVACSHLGLSAEERPEQARVIQATIQDRGPLILGGDLNEGPDGAVAATWRGWLVDCFSEAGTPEEPTGPGDRPRARIDFIYRTPDAPAVRGAFIGPTGASDHRPVIVDFHP